MNHHRKTYKSLLLAAEDVRQQIIENIGWYGCELPVIDASGDDLLIVWECGPMDWTQNDNLGLLQESNAELLSMGLPVQDYDRDNSAYWHDPAGILTEAQNHYSIAITEE